MIITISGTPGSGKSSVAKALAKTLGAKHYSAGDIRRKLASKMGVSISELNKIAENNPESDRLVDERLREFDSSDDNLVIDARLGSFFIPNSIKVFITASEEVRAQRVFRRKGKAEVFDSLDAAKSELMRRVKSDKKRYMKLYNIDPYDDSNYDLLIDSSHKSIDEVAGEIYRFARFREHKL